MNQWLKRISVLAISLALLPLSLSGQTVTVHGTVVDSNNEPLPGVNVYEEGTQNGVSTDLDGHYSITVKNGQSKVNFNCLGFQAEVFKASELSVVKRVVLKEDALMLDDAVAIGYGSVKKEDLTGSVSAIKAEGINRGVVTSADDLLKGKMTGVQIIPGGGGPGSSGTIRIRGAASLNASNDPLIVIDGVPMAHSSLSILNPNDIESFSVLKDASAAAIYGSRASNGVVLVTTKKGQAGQPLRISYNGSISMNTNPSRIDVMDADEFSATIREYYPEAAAKFIGNDKTDWQDLVLQTAYTSDHNLSISGSVKKMPYRASLGFLKEEGTIIGSWRNRGSGSVSLTPSLLDDHLKISLNGRINLSDGYSAHVLYSAAFFNPTMPPYFYNADGSIDYSTTGGYFNYGMGRGADFVPDSQAGINGAANPLESIFSTDRKGLTTRMVGNATYTYYVYQQLYDNDGKPIQNAFVDRDGNGTINDNDRYMAVTADGKAIKPAPDFFYGITFKATWKNWDFGFNGHGSVGNWLFNDAYASHSTTNANINYNYIANYSRSVLRSGFHSSNITAQSFSDMFLENASFFRMDDINLGYTFKWRSQKSTIRIALSAQNVFVLTKYSGLDPEASGENGIDSSMWPRPRAYSLRAAINF